MKIKLLVLLPLFFFFIHCKNKQQESTEKGTKELVSGDFNVTTINGEKTDNEKLHFSIDLDNNSIAGNGGCNNFNASFEHHGDDIEIGMPMATKMFCKDAQETEQQFFHALKAIKTYKFDGEVLKLTSEGGKTLIEAQKKG